jgi:heme-degrading monooxygenase HmoA
MTFVAINVLTVGDGMGETLEQRFAGRAGEVDQMEGFQHFELLRPAPCDLGPPSGEAQDARRYLVYTRWDSEAHFRAWVESSQFQHGHAQSSSQAPAATGSTLWTFEVAEERAAP